MKYAILITILIQITLGFRYPSPIKYYNYNSPINNYNYKYHESITDPKDNEKEEPLTPTELFEIHKLIQESMYEIKELPIKVMKKKELLTKPSKGYEAKEPIFKKNPRIFYEWFVIGMQKVKIFNKS